MLQYLLVALFVHGSLAVGIEVLKSWNNVDYNFPDGVSRDELINSGKFVPNNIAPLDVDVYNCHKRGPRIFVTTPMLKSGAPATLSTLAANGKLSPYPSWDWQSDSDCSKLISVLRITIDDWGRLWVVDDGKANAFADVPTFVCPPKVVIFDLKNDHLIGSYEIPTELYSKTNSLFANIAVDSKKPDKAFAFIADMTDARLLVFNLEKKSFWEWKHSALKPVSPYHEFIDINGVNFTLTDGVLALAYCPQNDRLYFNSFASVTQHSVDGHFLRNGPQLAGSENSYLTDYPGTRVSQATVHAISDNGVLFFNPIKENSLRCWDVSTPYTQSNHHIVAKDDERLQFVTGMKIRNGRYWGVSTRLQKFINGSTSPKETNYRIVTQTVKKLLHGSKCNTFGRNFARRGREHPHF